DPGGYPALALMVRSTVKDWAYDIDQLFRVMVFNILIGNKNDSAEKHFFVYDPEIKCWALAPACHLIPTLGRNDNTSMNIGAEGKARTTSNAISAAPIFGIKERDAERIVSDMMATCS